MSEQSYVTPGNKVGILRRALGLSQAPLADLLGVTRSTISAYENRTNASPSHEAVNRLAAEYGVEVKWFYDGANSPPEFIDRVATADKGDSRLHVFNTEPSVISVLRRSSTLSAFDLDRDHYHEREHPYALTSGAMHRGQIGLSDPDPSAILTVVHVDGWSLLPRMPQGSLVLFRQDPSPPEGAIVLATFRERWFYIKSLRVEDGAAWLDPAYSNVDALDSTIKPIDDWKIWGGATAVVHPYKQGLPNIEANGGQFLTGHNR